MILAIAGLIGGTLLLFFGADFIVNGAATLARKLGISPLVVGLTVVAFGTSLPEGFVSIVAAIQGNQSICVSNIVGSNIANVGLIMGLATLLWPVAVAGSLMRKEMPIMLGASVLFILFCLNGTVQRWEGGVFLILFILFTVYVLKTTRPTDDVDMPAVELSASVPVCIIKIVIGLIMLIAGASFLVNGAVVIARALGVPEWIIGVTLVAVGTSLPEMATSLVAITKKEDAISIGNVVGSNIFNILFVIGASALVRPLAFTADSALMTDLGIMLLFSIILYFFMIDRKISRRDGFVLLLGYCAFIVSIVMRTIQ
jgi:cation:H+ antiporter